MASGSQWMTTYYAKRIMGDNAASTADQALLQTGYDITTDTWILNRTNRPNYGILYHYDSNGADKIKFIGGINNNNDIEAAWIQLNAGDTYILGRVGIGEDPTINNNPYKLYINGTTYTNAPVYINNSTAVAMEDDNGALVIGDKAGLNIGIDNCKIHARDNSAAADLLLNSEGGNILLGVDDNDYYVNICSEQDASSTSTGALRVGGGAGITKKLYVGDDIHSDGHLYFAATKNIYMNYNGIDYPILENSDDSNIILNAATGILNIGHKNTIGINMYYSTDDSTRTQFFTINSNGAYANTRFGVNGQDTNYTLYVNGTGYLEDDLYIQGANNGIYFVGTQATYQMIKFIDNSSDAYGNGISIGGGGLTVLGSGESSDTILNNLSLTAAGGTETTYIGSDGSIIFYPNNNSWDASAAITMTASRLWVGVNENTAREAQVGVQSGAGQLYMWSHASTTGDRGIYTPAHGSGGARAIFSVNTNNRIFFADSYNGTATALAYSQSGLAASAITWLTCWNGYELRAISKAEVRNAVVSAGLYWANVKVSSSSLTSTTPSFGTCYSTDLRGANVRLVSNWVGFYSAANAGGNRYGYIQSDANRMYFRKENGANNNIGFDFGHNIYCSSEYISGTANGFRIKNVILRNDGANFYFLVGTSNTPGDNWNSLRPFYWNLSNGYCYHTRAYQAVWNDYAEFRKGDTIEPGYCVIETSSGIMTKSTSRLQPGAKMISDTYGEAMGETKEAKTPIAVSGRMLAYTYRNRNEYPLGAAVCSAPNGTIDIMTREEIMLYPERIVGTVSEIPNYDVWNSGGSVEQGPSEEIKVNGRIWIYVR